VSLVASWDRRDVLAMGWSERVRVGEMGREACGVLMAEARREPCADAARKRARSWGV
jgi:hypothetical protein